MQLFSKDSMAYGYLEFTKPFLYQQIAAMCSGFEFMGLFLGLCRNAPHQPRRQFGSKVAVIHFLPNICYITSGNKLVNWASRPQRRKRFSASNALT